MQSIADALWAHCATQATLLALCAVVAWRLGRLHWLSGSFWAIAAFAVYFVVHPLGVLVGGDLGVYAEFLAYAGGADRVAWLTLVIAAGLVAFFAASFLTTPGTPGRWALRSSWQYRRSWPPGSVPVLLAALTAAVYSLMAFRVRLGAPGATGVEIEGGRFVGGVTGYQFVFHLLALYPIILFGTSRQAHPWGRILMVVYVALRLFNPWDRHSIISLLLGLSMASLVAANAAARGAGVARRRWPRRAWAVTVVGLTVLLQLREHRTLDDWWRDESRLARPERLVSGADSSMLPGLYLRTFVDERRGWTYGVDLAGSAMFGWLPRKYFPWKSDLPALVFPGRDRHVVPGEELLAGTKSTVIGSFYSYGGLFAVVLCMALFGYVITKAERFLADEVAGPLQALACTGFGGLWMIFGSDAEWGIGVLYLLALPAVAIVGLHLVARYSLAPHLARPGAPGDPWAGRPS